MFVARLECEADHDDHTAALERKQRRPRADDAVDADDYSAEDDDDGGHAGRPTKRRRCSHGGRRQHHQRRARLCGDEDDEGDDVQPESPRAEISVLTDDDCGKSDSDSSSEADLSRRIMRFMRVHF
eukprot:m51a1_g13097 hypothetical protein (126) ;mRNA; r:308-1258